MLMRLLAAFLVAHLSAFALAHGPTPQKVEHRITVAASPAVVWAVVGDFANLAAWHPLVAKSTGNDVTGAGAERVVTLKSGGEIVDGLDEYDAAGRTYTYRLLRENPEAFPVSFYSAILTVSAAGEGRSEVVWQGRFYRGDTGNYPPDNLSDAAAIKAMTDFFHAGFEGLKAKIEGH
jgi:mxaD protein